MTVTHTSKYRDTVSSSQVSVDPTRFWGTYNRKMVAPKKLEGDDLVLAKGIGERLAQLRVNSNATEITQEQLGSYGSVTKAHISGLENGRHFPSLMLLLNIRKHRKFSWNWLIGGEGDPLVNQLITFYEGLSKEKREQLLNNANWLYSQEHPEPSIATPFGVEIHATQRK